MTQKTLIKIQINQEHIFILLHALIFLFFYDKGLMWQCVVFGLLMLYHSIKLIVLLSSYRTIYRFKSRTIYDKSSRTS